MTTADAFDRRRGLFAIRAELVEAFQQPRELLPEPQQFGLVLVECQRQQRSVQQGRRQHRDIETVRQVLQSLPTPENDGTTLQLRRKPDQWNARTVPSNTEVSGTQVHDESLRRTEPLLTGVWTGRHPSAGPESSRKGAVSEGTSFTHTKEPRRGPGRTQTK